VVQEIESLTEGSHSRKALTSDDLPAPEGAVITNKLPEEGVEVVMMIF